MRSLSLLILVLVGICLGFEDTVLWPGAGFVMMLALVAMWGFFAVKSIPQLAPAKKPSAVVDHGRAAR